MYLLVNKVDLEPIQGIFYEAQKRQKTNKNTIISFLKLCFYIFIHLAFYSLEPLIVLIVN